jgi:hypothetical protein
MNARYLRMAIATALALMLAPALTAAAQAAGPGGATPPAPAAGFLFLGSYHMANHNRDVHNTRADDVLAAKRQQEIAEVARLIERYRPTKVMVEADPASQAELDAEFAASCKGDRQLGRDEIEQVGYRVACDLGLPGVVGVNWNDLGPISDEASVDYVAAIERHGQQAQRARDMAVGNAQAARDQAVLDHGSIGDMLRHLNSPEWLAANARAYFRIGLYGTADDPTGANWMMLWFGRNQIIFNNIVRHTESGDRVLVVYGAGHGNLLRQLAADSGFYRLEDTERWLHTEPSH